MKYLVLLVVVFAVLWYLRSGARRVGSGAQDGPARRGPSAKPQDMVECPVCHVHLPRADALAGPNGQHYCCAEHRLRAEG